MSYRNNFSRVRHGFTAYFYLLSLLSFSVIAFMPFTGAASAETHINTQVTAGSNQTYEISDDTVITLSSGQTGTGINIAQNSSNVVIRADAGKVLSIDVSTPKDSGANGGGEGIFVNSSDNVIIDLGETHIKAAESNALNITGTPTGPAGTVASFGNNSTFESAKSGAVTVSRNAIVNIGNDSFITGNSFGPTVAALLQNNGAVVTVGNSATISNQDSRGYGVNSIAVLSYNSTNYLGGYIEIGDKSKIYTTGTGSGNYAVLAGYVGSTGQVLYSGDVRIGKSADISTVGGTSSTGLGSHALVSAGEGSIITVDDFAKISTAGQQAAAVRAGLSANGVQTGGGTVTIGASADISTGGSGSIAVDARYAGSKIIIGKNATIATASTSGSSYGVSAQSQGIVDIGENAKISTNSTSGYGAYATGSGSAINIGSGSSITTRASIGAYAASAGEVKIGSGSSITTQSGSSAYGLYATGSGSKLTLGAGSSVTTATAYGAYAASSGTVDIGGGTSIATLSGTSAYGLYATGNNSNIKLGADSSVTTASADAVYANSGGSIELESANISAASGDKNAINATGRYSSTGQGSTISGSGVFNIEGDIYTGTYGLVDLTAKAGSVFTGATAMQTTGNGTSLSLAMEKSRWNITKDSYLTNLTLDNSTVDFESSPAFTTLTIEKLNSSVSGTGGTFIMKADIQNESSDQIIVTDRNSSGLYDIKVLNIGSADVTGDEIVTLATTAFGSGVSFELANIVEYGAWQYGMNYVQGIAASPGGGIEIDDEWQLRATPRASNSGSGAINSFAGSYLMAYADTQTLIQRMGDLRQSPYGNGLWFRVHGGKFESNSKTYVRGFDMDYGGVQVGYDRKIENKWDGDLYVGAMFGYSKGDLDYGHEGSGEVDSKTLGIYGTYIGRSGFYVDAVLKYQWMTNDFDAIDTAGTLVRGHDVDTGGIGASVEFGQRLHVGKGKDNGAGWYVEPQVQLSYQRQDGGYFNATNGLRIGVDSFNSLLGRIGMQAGYETEKSNLYAKVSKVKEFDGDLTIYANGIRIPESFASSWWVYGIGYTSRINDRNSLYIDIERTSDGSFSQPWRVFAGWRVEF